VSDPHIVAWISKARKLVGMPARHDEAWLRGHADQILARLDAGQLDGLTPELQERMHDRFLGSRPEPVMAQQSPRVETAFRELMKTYSEVRSEGIGLLKLCDDPTLSNAERAAVRKHLQRLHRILEAKYMAAREAVG
jgi:hypothetical protein